MRGWRPASRRAFLGGAGTVVALPFLESLVPREARAAAGNGPRRVLYYYVPNGIHMAAWTPTAAGAAYQMPPILKSLTPLRSHLSIVTGLGNPNGHDPAAGHSPATGAYLTCTRVSKTIQASETRAGISADQLAAAAIGKMTRFQSLQLGVDGGQTAGRCDGDYSCAYTRTLSWASPTTPLPKLTNPQTVFDQLFGGCDPKQARSECEKRSAYRKSVLDVVTADAQSLNLRLGATDRHKLDEFMDGVRELERRIGQAPIPASCDPGDRPPSAELSKNIDPNSNGKYLVDEGTRPEGALSIPDHVRLMNDLMVLSFQCDLTRVITFMQANSQSPRAYTWLGISEGHHITSHHMDLPANLAALQKINTWEIEQFAYLLDRLDKIVADPNGQSLLYNSAVHFSSECSDGNSHSQSDLPVILAGHGGGDLKPGRHIMYPAAAEQRSANLHLRILQTVGAKGPLGDGTTALTEV